MTLSDIETSVHESIDSGDPDTLEFYAVHCAEGLAELGELLCLSIINTNHVDWSDIISVAARREPALASALEAIEQHCDRQRAAFIEQRARNIQDVADHNAICLAELQAELDGGRRP